jgi:FlaA1/EpsC-like NDP-sugar epimerase
MGQLLYWALHLHRWEKRLIQLLVDTGLIAGSFMLAMIIKEDSLAPLSDVRFWSAIALTLPATLLVFIRLGFYHAVIRYVSTKAIQLVALGVSSSIAFLIIADQIFDLRLSISHLAIYALLCTVTVGGIRFLMRSLYQQQHMKNKSRVAIYGAGDTGSRLAQSLIQGSEYAPVFFIDDWRGMRGTQVEGLKVYSPQDLEHLIERYEIEKILLAIPSASLIRRREIIKTLEELPIPIQTVPGAEDIVSGRARINEIQDISIEDLLGRDPIPPNEGLLSANIRDKVVLVTGAGGSIGSELCRQIITQSPRQLLLLDACEFSLYRIESELKQAVDTSGKDISVKALLGSVQQRSLLESLMMSFRVNTIYHAAAYKHVPMVEHNALEGIRNNVYGTLETAQSAIACGVETFVLVSTDKAVRPTNVMGTTKRLAELICQALAHHQATTRFCMVRFGNVLGSSGSVVPLFRKQISMGGPITVTHPEVTRYFMTIPEAAQLVIQAGAMGKGGDVFVLDMGEPVRIVDLARHMVKLSGLELISEDNPGGDIALTYSGLRPGEKLYEELLIGNKATHTKHPRIMSAKETYWEWPRLDKYLKKLNTAITNADHKQIRKLLISAPTDYNPEGPISDLVWVECEMTLSSPTKDYPPSDKKSDTDQEPHEPIKFLQVSSIAMVKGDRDI